MSRFLSVSSLLTATLLVLGLTSCFSPPSPPPPTEDPPAEVLPQPEQPEPAPLLPYRNPLTGEPLAQDIRKNRPVAIMLNNLKKALPQLGISKADLIYEAPAEGGITRMMAVFQSLDGVEEIGSVRSAREYYLSLALGHDAIYLHAGGSPGAYHAIKNWGVNALDCVNGPYEGTLYWRDQERRKTMGWEHSVLTSGPIISELLPTYGLRLEHKEQYDPKLTFLPQGAKAKGEPAHQVEITFSTYKTGVFTYDPQSGYYQVSQYQQPYVDGTTQEQVSVKNVLVLRTDVSLLPGDEAGRLSVRTTGTGTGQLFCDGTVQDLIWSKGKHSDPLVYSTPDGAPLALGVGPSYINLVAQDTPVSVLSQEKE